ncbi:helix-turn-helix domain-containing protein [Leucobacter sp. UCMA 4100]|uniref:helix-turn-helix domain-containing protein n=2 Tax=Leucobacter sp. UCMA 4100 TaxID=2810534 RepID=UPI002FDC5539
MAETDSTAMSGIAMQVCVARKDLGWSQGLLAAKAGVSRPSVARVEASDAVSTDTLSKISEVLGLKLTLAEVPPDDDQ